MSPGGSDTPTLVGVRESPQVWSSRFRRSFTGRLPYFTEMLPQKVGRALDLGNVGFGASPHTWLREVVAARGGRLVGIDLDFEQARSAGHPRQTVGSVFALPFVDGSFDAIFMGELIEHLWDPLASLREVRRVLRDGGRLILTTPHVYSVGRLAAWVLLGRDSVGHPDHKFLFTPAAMSNLLQCAGYDVEDMCSDKKWALGSQLLPWVPWGRRVGAYLLVTAKKV